MRRVLAFCGGVGTADEGVGSDVLALARGTKWSRTGAGRRAGVGRWGFKGDRGLNVCVLERDKDE